jgi:hypothetical protein
LDLVAVGLLLTAITGTRAASCNTGLPTLLLLLLPLLLLTLPTPAAGDVTTAADGMLAKLPLLLLLLLLAPMLLLTVCNIKPRMGNSVSTSRPARKAIFCATWSTIPTATSAAAADAEASGELMADSSACCSSAACSPG